MTNNNIWLRRTVWTWSQMDCVSAWPYGWNSSAHQFQPIQSNNSVLYLLQTDELHPPANERLTFGLKCGTGRRLQGMATTKQKGWIHQINLPLSVSVCCYWFVVVVVVFDFCLQNNPAYTKTASLENAETGPFTDEEEESSEQRYVKAINKQTFPDGTLRERDTVEMCCRANSLWSFLMLAGQSFMFSCNPDRQTLIN